MRIIRYIAVHCTASSTDATPEDLIYYWKNEKKWKAPGYHYLVMRDGEVVQLLDESKVSNGVKGYNQITVNVAYLGGIDKQRQPLDNRTSRQSEALFNLLVELSSRYPEAEILGHRDFPNANKACPSFNVREWLRDFTPTVLGRVA